MPKKKLALERGGPKRLELRWKRRFLGGIRDVEVTVDGNTWKLTSEAVRSGATIALAGGSQLLVHWVRRNFWSVGTRDELRIERDGVPVPGSDGDPRVIGRRAAWIILLFGLFRLLYGVAAAGRGDELDTVAALVGLSGAVLLVLGILAALGRRLPLAIAAGVLVAEIVLVLGSRVAPTGLVIQVLVIVHLVQAWQRTRPRAAAPTLAAIFE